MLLQAVLQSSVLADSVRNQDAALAIVRNEIETLRSGGYDSLPESGSFYDDTLSALPSGNGVLVVNSYNDKTKQVTATVTWQEQNRLTTSSVSLSTLITDIGGLQ